MQGFADLINGFSPNEAYALGRIKDGLPDRVRVIRADKLNGVSDPAIIARTQDYLVFNEGEFGLALLDADFKGVSPDVARRMEEVGGFWGALCEVLPALETIACVERASTSSGLRDSKTGKVFSGSGGRHVVIPVLDAADIPRFLADLHARCWLNGFGWGITSAAGSFLERSIVDKSCGTPERLVFEGAPVIVPPLVQQGRNAIAHEGFILDTRLCAPLTNDENVELRKLLEAEESRLLPERQAARALWELTHIKQLTAGGMSEADARAQIDRWIDRKELSGAFVLPFDDPKIAGASVAQVLADPEQFVGKTLSDPFEGPDYGAGKAVIYRRANGSMFINSFAHGGITYELKSTSKAAPTGPVFDPWEKYIVPEFPLQVLPRTLQNYVTSQSVIIGCDPAALAMAALTTFSGALDHRFAVKMMRSGNWWEHPRLWTLLVGDPSRKKTPVINDATGPLEYHQKELRRRYEAELSDYEAVKKEKDNTVEKPDPPVRYVVWDSTTEKLGEILIAQ